MKKKPLIIEIPVVPGPTKLQFTLEKCRLAWDEGGNVLAIWQALTLCREVPLPDWLYLANIKLLDSYLKRASMGGKGRHARWREQYRQDVSDWLAHGVVKGLRHKGVHGDRAFEEAVKILREDFKEKNTWTFDSVRNGFLRYKKQLKENRHTYFAFDSTSPEHLFRKHIVKVFIKEKRWPSPSEFEPLFQEEEAARRKINQKEYSDMLAHKFLGNREFSKKLRRNHTK
jgi:hypothetical protein